MTKTEERQRGTKPQGQRAIGDRGRELKEDEMSESQRQRKRKRSKRWKRWEMIHCKRSE